MKHQALRFGLVLAIVAALCAPVLTASGPTPVVAEAGNTLVPSLIYHRVLANPTSMYDLTPGQLEGHLKFLKDHGYQPITALQYLEFQKNRGKLPAKPVMLTFDDGHRSNYTAVFPLLKKYGMTATFFVVPQVIAEKSDLCLTWGELEEMAQAGMDIESHTMSHPYLTNYREAGGEANYLTWLGYQLQGSKTLIEEKLRRPVVLLAYPYGWYDATVEAVAIRAGYQGIHTVNWGNNQLNDNPYRVKRHVMENSMGLVDLDRILTIRPLHIQIIAPADTAILSVIPVIQFKVRDKGIKNIEIHVRNYKANLDPDLQGIYTFGAILELKPGYSMIIVKGYDAEGHLYETSWGFNFRVPQQSGT